MDRYEGARPGRLQRRGSFARSTEELGPGAPLGLGAAQVGIELEDRSVLLVGVD